MGHFTLYLYESVGPLERHLSFVITKRLRIYQTQFSFTKHDCQIFLNTTTLVCYDAINAISESNLKIIGIG